MSFYQSANLHNYDSQRQPHHCPQNGYSQKTEITICQNDNYHPPKYELTIIMPPRNKCYGSNGLLPLLLQQTIK